MAAAYADPNAGNTTILAAGILAFVATVTTVLRFWARRILGLRPAPDDYLSALLLLLVYGLLVVTVFAVLWGGLGAMNIFADEDEQKTSELFKCFYAFCFIYGTAATLAKLCVLVFYHRMFPTVFMRRCCILLGVVSLLHGGVLLVGNALQCRSWLSSTWQNPGHCIDVPLFNAILSVPDSVIDVLVLCLPIRELARLQTTRTKKALLCGVFLTGALSVFSSVARINTNLGWYFHGPKTALIGPWTAALVEVGSAAVAACLPTLPPVWHRLRRTRLRSGPSTGASHSSASRNKNRKPGSGGAPTWSVLTIGRISSGNPKSRKRAGVESGLFTTAGGIEMHNRTTTELCRNTESPVPASPRASSELGEHGGNRLSSAFEAPRKEGSSRQATYTI